ncbi:MAG TPA: DUF5130 domain-containing protein [Actinobacteria bacterium]|nr:DUF5130 domain-containing protein [Actinomycetota bacterium]
MPAGDPSAIASGAVPITDSQRRDLMTIVDKARTLSGFAFAIYVGPLPAGRASALEQHATLRDPAATVLVAVSPAERLLEIVTGANVAVDLDDQSCRLAALSMTTSFAAGDLVGGLREGCAMLAEHARYPRVLHLDEPA